MQYQIAFIVFGLACAVLANPIAKVEKQIWRNLDESELTNVLITFKNANTKAAYNRFYSLKLTTREAILVTQHAILKDHADAVQADVRSMLEKSMALGKRHYLDQLWITNELIVRDVDREIVEKLRDHPDVKSLVAEQFFPLLGTIGGESYDYNNTILLNTWGVVNVQAPVAWTRGFTGTGVDIGNIGTGAHATHDNLSPTYRGNNFGENHNYNWRAPSGNAAVPFDTDGRGTHSIGVHSGTDGIGVAPNSRWLACRGCNSLSFILGCSSFDLNSCGNFMACPTNTTGGGAQCTRAPRIVHNGWRDTAGGQTWYNPILTAWRNANIAGVFGIGNGGTECSTVASPGDQEEAFGVGSIDSVNTLSTFSGVGPGPASAIKPNVAAPGTAIISASNLSTTGKRTVSGDGSAAAHVSGALAFIWQARPFSTVLAAQGNLQSSALAHTSEGRECGGTSEYSRPNYHVGYGRINANGAI